MVAPISSLANMEMKLYGGFGQSTIAPSYSNGYNMSVQNQSIYNQLPYQNYYNSANNIGFGQNIQSSYYTTPSAQNTIAQQNTAAKESTGASQTSAFQGLTKKESDALVKYYAKGLSPTETLVGAATGQAFFSILNHPRLLAHPINSISTLGYMEKLFKPMKDTTTAIGKLYADKSTNNLAREFYFQVHKALSRRGGKFGLFRQTSKGENLKEVDKLLIEAKKLINNPNATADDIADLSARLKHSYIDNGKIKEGWYWLKNKLSNGKIKAELPTVKEALSNTEAIAETKTKLLQKAPTDFKGFLKSGQGIGGAALWLGCELLFSWGKIRTAFKHDSENEENGISTNKGWKQLGQTVVKALGSAAGWAVGEAAGATAFANWGAKLGTLVSPGLGTALGGISGFIAGGIGLWLAGKVTRALVGQDVADKIEAEKLAKSQEGQIQLLQYTAQQAEAGKNVPIEAQQALQKVINQYA